LEDLKMIRSIIVLIGACWAAVSVSAVQTLHFTKEVELLLAKGTNGNHYGDPTTGCMIDEVAIKVQGVRGGICTAHCTTVGACPSDKPAGSEAIPRCALENRSTGEKFCALMCSAGMNCGSGASCKVIQGNLGICTYDDVYAQNLRAIDEEN